MFCGTIQRMLAFLLLFPFVFSDAEFLKVLLDDESVWHTLADEAIPPEQDLEALKILADKLARWVLRSYLKEHATTLHGTVVFVTKHDTLYRCTMKQDNGVIDIYTPFLPKAWNEGGPMQERSAAFGVYVKTYKNTPVFLAPAMRWYPDTWLGNLGFDVASFDQVPVGRVTELEQHDEETNRRMFKFTEADWDPFYGLLKAISNAPKELLEEEAKKQQAEMPIGVTDLFNHPHKVRSKAVMLRGTAKRVVPTPVTDSEVQTLFGIDHYYQIFLFSEQSQGNPIVVCVRELPEGMPTGSADDFAETITVAAVPYKLWIYETTAGPHYAPLLVGQTPVWHPKPRPPQSITNFSFTFFFVLVLIWFGCRLWARRK